VAEVLAPAATDDGAGAPVVAPLTRQVPLALAPAPSQHFDNFVVGDNALLIETLRGALTGTPVYLWGAAGTGKTHLLRALAEQALAGGLRVAAFGMADAAPWEFDGEARLVLLDDVGRYDAAQQHAAFSAFVDAATRGATIVAAGRLPPIDLPVREDLRTRLAWGLVYQVQMPGEEQVRAALRREADRRSIWLSDRVMHYLMTRFARDLGHLMGLLERLDEFSLASKRRVSVELLKTMLADEEAA
jgi:DnaA family protein